MKLYITDMDGTLLNYREKIPIMAADIINREIARGVMFSCATARSIYSARPILDCLDISLPVITYNGAALSDIKTGRNISVHSFTENSIKLLSKLFADKNEALITYSVINGTERLSFYPPSVNKTLYRYLESRKDSVRMRECKCYDDLFDGEVFYATIMSPKADISSLNAVFCRENGFTAHCMEDIYNKGEYWFELYRNDVSKGKAAAALKKEVGANELICFGDNLNDISLFDAADRSYAVKNAVNELKARATGVIRSNAQSGVAVFIANDGTTKQRYEKMPLTTEPDREKFRLCLDSAFDETGGIGTLNEKAVHAALKSYFSTSPFDKEIKIGGYYADVVNDNGIAEIQTKAFDKLKAKLSTFLDAAHVTVVYPFKKRTRLSYFNKKDGSLIKTGSYITHNDMTDFFLELYRIKEYLNNPNLTICIAELYVENLRFTASDLKRRKTDIKKTVPEELCRLVYLENSDSYRMFLPNGLPRPFTKRDFKKACNMGDSSIILEILKDVGVIDLCGKRGNELLFEICEQETTTE